MSVIPWVAILVATVVSFFLGALWYSPFLFEPAWKRERGLDAQGCPSRPPVRLLGASFVLTLISTSLLSFCLAPKPGIVYGAIAGLVIGIGWVATSIGTNFLFEERSFKYFAITAGYHIVRFLVAGIVLGLLQ